LSPMSGGRLTIVEAQRRTELFLTGQMLEVLVEYELPSFETEPVDVELADVARSCVEIRHVRGASDATYLVSAFGDELLMQLQLNVLASSSSTSACAQRARHRHSRGAPGALAHWRRACRLEIRLRDAQIAADPGGVMRDVRLRLRRQRFFEDELQQLYWRTDIMQMTRYYMIEVARSGIRLSPRRAGFPV
jgi:hypothetical protein